MQMTVGPLPPSVYWRRRAMVSAVILLSVLLLGMCVSRGDDEAGKQVPTSQSTERPSEDPPAANLPGANDDGNTGGGKDGTAVHPDAETGTGGENGDGDGKGDPADGAGAAPSPEAKQPVCTDSAIDVEPSLERPKYTVGEKPKMKLTIRNVSEEKCWRDVGADFQELRVMLGGQRIWSSDDCAPLHGWDNREFAPHQSISFTLVWAGTTSKPNCPAPRVQTKPGTYQLYARLGTEMSGPLNFTIAS
jgi:hypothetical protein